MEKLFKMKIEQKKKRPTPWFVAVQHDQESMVEHLFKKCKNEKTSNMDGVTPLLIAVKEGNVDISLDERRGFQKDHEDRNVLHCASLSQKPEELTAKLLAGRTIAVIDIYPQSIHCCHYICEQPLNENIKN